MTDYFHDFLMTVERRSERGRLLLILAKMLKATGYRYSRHRPITWDRWLKKNLRGNK